MQGVHDVVGLDGAGAGHQGLTGDLAAEDPLVAPVGADGAPEDVHLDRLEVEQGDEGVHGRLVHRSSLARPDGPDGPHGPSR